MHIISKLLLYWPRIAYAIMIFAFLLIIVLLQVKLHMQNANYQRNQKFAWLLRSEFTDSERNSIPVAHLTTFSWDSVCYRHDSADLHQLEFRNAHQHIVQMLDITSYDRFDQRMAPAEVECAGEKEAIFQKKGHFFYLDSKIIESRECGNDRNVFRTEEGLYSENIASGEVVQIAPLPAPPRSYIFIQDCSPDGEWIGYETARLPGNIKQYAYHFATKKAVLLGVGSYSFRWSPDGKKMQYAWYSELEPPNEPAAAKRFFTSPEGLPWKALEDTNALDVKDTLWLADSSAVIARDFHHRYRIKEFTVTKTGFSHGDLIWDGGNGLVNLRAVMPDNRIFFEYASEAFMKTHSMQAEKILSCRKKDIWQCGTFLEGDIPSYHLYGIIPAESIVYVPDGESSKGNEIWIRTRKEKRRITTVKGKIASLSVNGPYVYFFLVNDRSRYQVKWEE